MAKLIRDYDWTDHPFGPPATWPQSLRSALSICLQSAFPTAIYWGSELRLLYNDAWSPIPGPRHPEALGAPAREVWSDIWHVIEPQFSHLVTTGEGIFVEDQMLPMRRFGGIEETYWSYSFTPIRGEDGAIAGVFNSGSETTRNVLSQRQMRFLLALGEAFRKQTDLASARRMAISMLGEHLRVARVGLREQLSDSTDELATTDEWTAQGVDAAFPAINPSTLGRWASAELRSGHVLRIDNVSKHAELGEAREVFEAMGVAAVVAVPWMAQGRTTAVIFLHSQEPRKWNDFDVTTAEAALARTLNWIERERMAERERMIVREIDHRAKNALAVVQSVIRLTAAKDVTGFKEKIEDRIATLARSHALLAAERWRPVELAALLQEELAPYFEAGSAQVSAKGPPVAFRPEQAQAVALLLHELTTNAAKHGALKDEGGRLNVSWSSSSEGAVTIKWSEANVQAGRQKGRSHGFGSTLLTRVVEQLGGSIDQRFAGGALQCEITIPFSPAELVVPSRQRIPQPSVSKADEANRRSVLIVEDEPFIAMDLEIMFEDLGHSIFATVSSVESALFALERGTPQFAIVDMNLSGDSSLRVAEVLLKRNVPFVFATGYAEFDNLPSYLADIPRLSKPVSEKDLIRMIAQSAG